MIANFGADTQLIEVIPEMAEQFFTWMRTEEELSESHARRTVGYAKQYFIAAIDEGLIAKEPFGKISARVKSNKLRQHYINVDTANKILNACPNEIWKLKFVLLRWMGLRCAIEMNALRWQDVNWAENRVFIRDQKRKHNGENKGIRPQAIFPEVLSYLQKAFHEAPDGAEFVLPRLAHKNYTRSFNKILKHAGVTP